MIEYILLFASSFLSATLLPGSSEAALGGLVALGRHSVAGLIAVATLGNTLGACVNWALGVMAAGGARRVRLPLTEAQIARFGRWYARFGSWSLLFTWVPVIGDPLTVVAGLARTPLAIFVPVVALGKALRYLAVAGIAGWAF